MSSYLSPHFTIGQLKIGTVEGASCVNFGNNIPANFQNHKKHNQGFGNVGGDHNKIEEAISALDDADLLDMFNHSDDEVPEWLREWLTAVSETEPEFESPDSEK